MRYYIDEMTREHMFVLRQVHRRAWQKIIPKPQAQQEVGYTYSWHPHIITTSHAYVGVKQDHDAQSVSEKHDEEWSRSMPHTLWGIDSSLSAERRGQRYPVYETETSSITVRRLVWGWYDSKSYLLRYIVAVTVTIVRHDGGIDCIGYKRTEDWMEEENGYSLLGMNSWDGSQGARL